MNESKDRVGGWEVGVGGVVYVVPWRSKQNKDIMAKNPHSEQPFLSRAAFLCACPELVSFSAYFLP